MTRVEFRFGTTGGEIVATTTYSDQKLVPHSSDIVEIDDMTYSVVGRSWHFKTNLVSRVVQGDITCRVALAVCYPDVRTT